MVRIIIFISFFIISNVNAALVITNSTETNVSVSSLKPSLISANGNGFSPFLDKVEPDCCDGQQALLAVDFTIIGSQKIIVDVTLSSNGNSNSIMSQLKIQKNDPLEYILGAVSQAEDSSLEGDDWVTDYTSLGTLVLEREILLTEGDYSLSARAFADQFGGVGESSFLFSVTAVPVPAGIWLLSSGLIILFRNVRKTTSRY